MTFLSAEKAAGEILPGQETKPSGYAEYLASHQDRPWETLSYAPPFDPVGKQHNNIHPQSIAYDDPYDAFDGSAGESQNGLHQLGFYPKNIYADPHNHHNGTDPGQPLTLEQELSQVKLKQQTIESYLPQVQMTNGLDQVTGTSLNGSLGGHKGEEEESRGLIASQPASIQTDSLSPASERELLSYSLPKSDILVVGHGQDETECKLYEELDTQRKMVDMGTDTIYAAANSIERPPQQDDNEPASTDANGATDSHAVDEFSNFNQTAGSTTGMETETTWVQSQNVDGSGPAKDNSTPFSEEVLHDGLAANQGAITGSLHKEIVATGFETEEKPAVSAVVGFGTDECEMDKDEMEAYLQDLEVSSMSGDDADRLVQAVDPSISLSAQEDITQNGVAQPSKEDITNAEDNTAASVNKSAFVRGSAVVGDSEVVNVSGDGGDSGSVSNNATDSIGAIDSSVTGLPQTSERAEETVQDCGADPSDSSILDVKQPDVVADISHRMTDTHPEHMNIDQEKVRGDGDGVNLDNRPPDSKAVTNNNKSGMSLSLNSSRLTGDSSLEFPVTNSNSELSSVMKGKLEIEGLLDEIVAARLAQKSSEVVNTEAAPGTQEVPVVLEQTALRDGGTSNNKSRTEGWGPEGSMVCSRVRESSSESPAESSSPSPTLGIGARPKDPSQMKKNRPNSLLGLSKISLSSPFSPPQQSVGPVIGVMLPSAHQQQAGEGSRTALPPQMEPSDTDREARTQVHGLGGRHLGSPPPDVSATVHIDGVPAPGAMDTAAMEEEELEAPVMRHQDVSGDSGVAGEGVEASSGMQRPRSWSPSTVSSPPAQKMKRPTSLNLPVRQDRVGSVSPDGENARSRKAGFLQEAGLASETGSSGQLVYSD